MSVQTELLDVLDRCLVDVRAGRTTIERCLADHPAERRELEALLRTAMAIVPSQVAANPAAKLRGRVALVEAMHAGVDSRSSSFLSALLDLRRRAAAMATALVITVTSSGVAVVAAQDAQPYEPLYPLKTAVEQQQLAFAASPEARAQLRVHIAARRLAEADRAIEAGREDAAIFAAAAYGETMQQAYGDMDAAQNVGRGAVEAHEAAEDSLARLHDVTARASSSGSRDAAAALAAAAAQTERERAERERPRPASVTPSRPSAPIPSTAQPDVVRTGERPAVALAPEDDDSDIHARPQALEHAAPAAQAAGGALGAPAADGPASVRPPAAVPTARAQAQGNPGAQGSEQRGSAGSNNQDDRGRGRSEIGSESEGPRLQIEPTLAPTTLRVLPTPTLQVSGGDREDQGRGRDDNRDRGGPARTPTPSARPATSSDERGRPAATSTNRSGNRDRDEDDEDRNRNRGRD